jgi:hypothetical protein
VSLDPKDYNIPAQVASLGMRVKAKSEVPPATDILGTMKYWDDYRLKERARIAQTMEMNGLFLDDSEHGGILQPDELAKLTIKIGEMPNAVSLAKIAKAEEAERLAAEKRARAWSARWARLKQRLNGLWKQSVSSGGPFVRRKRGTRGKD